MGIVPMVTPLGDEDCLRLLGSASIGRVALTIGALPASRTVRFALTPGRIVFRIASDPRLRQAVGAVIAFQVDHFDLAW